MFKRILFITVIIIAIATGAASENTIQKEKIVILFGHRFPPFYSIDKSSETASNLKGYFIDILENFKKSHPQYNLIYVCLPKGRINKVLRDGNADCFALTDPMFVSQEIKNKFTTSTPLWRIGDHLLVKSNSIIKNTNIDNLRGKHIAVLHGNKYGPLDEYFDTEAIHKHAVYRTSQILELIMRERVDGAICNKITLPQLIKRTRFSSDSFRLIESPLYEYNLHLLVKKKKNRFLNDFNKFIATAQIQAVE